MIIQPSHYLFVVCVLICNKKYYASVCLISPHFGNYIFRKLRSLYSCTCSVVAVSHRSLFGKFVLTSELVAERLVVGELAGSKGSDALTNVAAGAVEGNSAIERRALKKNATGHSLVHRPLVIRYWYWYVELESCLSVSLSFQSFPW